MEGGVVTSVCSSAVAELYHVYCHTMVINTEGRLCETTRGHNKLFTLKDRKCHSAVCVCVSACVFAPRSEICAPEQQVSFHLFPKGTKTGCIKMLRDKIIVIIIIINPVTVFPWGGLKNESNVLFLAWHCGVRGQWCFWRGHYALFIVTYQLLCEPLVVLHLSHHTTAVCCPTVVVLQCARRWCLFIFTSSSRLSKKWLFKKSRAGRIYEDYKMLAIASLFGTSDWISGLTSSSHSLVQYRYCPLIRDCDFQKILSSIRSFFNWLTALKQRNEPITNLLSA